VVIFVLGVWRDSLYNNALNDQPSYAPIHQPWVAYLLSGVGTLLVVSSMWALGVTGTYLGDYFGILMDAPVTGFPFNISASPMYWGSTMNFLAAALWKGKLAGLLLTLEVFVMYWFALQWEE
jgi:phosphatidylethanolamine/phosphatidyl-N-methylethanolamine N-methyltransferase